MNKLVINPVPSGHAPLLATQVNGIIQAMKPYHVPITSAERIGRRSMAEGREGLVRLISRIAAQHPESLSRADNPAEMLNMLEVDAQLETLRQACMQLLEMVEHTQFANSCDVMVLCDAYNAALQIDRKRNSALDSSMAEVDDWNSRYRNTQNETPGTEKP
ncbi:hypothetical protein [Rurimicrobium arvi]|uniref:Uncharacterized protein n=1 Tax=Rurimicrobium arvi TaxID=2049916 RepID=A0ABP8MZS8_9BACT